MKGEDSVVAFSVEYRVSFVPGKWKCRSIVTLDVFAQQYETLFSSG